MADIEQVLLPNGTTYDIKDHTIRDEVQYKIYDSIADVPGFTSNDVGSATISGVFQAMPNLSILLCTAGEFTTGTGGVPVSTGIVEIVKLSSQRTYILFYGKTETNGDYRMFCDGSTELPTGTWIRSDLRCDIGTPTASSGTISSGSSVTRTGNTVVLDYAATGVTISTSSSAKIGAIPSRFAPSGTIFGIGIIGFGTAVCYVDVTSNGEIRARGATAQTNAAIRINLTWTL